MSWLWQFRRRALEWYVAILGCLGAVPTYCYEGWFGLVQLVFLFLINIQPRDICGRLLQDYARLVKRWRVRIWPYIFAGLRKVFETSIVHYNTRHSYHSLIEIPPSLIPDLPPSTRQMASKSGLGTKTLITLRAATIEGPWWVWEALLDISMYIYIILSVYIHICIFWENGLRGISSTLWEGDFPLPPENQTIFWVYT